MRTRIVALGLVANSLALSACSSSSSTGTGSPGGGGSAAADGGPSSNGGSNSVGGATASGGATSSGGGTSSSGGASASSGGATSSGGSGNGGTAPSSGGATGSGGSGTISSHAIQRVVIVLEENHGWSAIKGSANAPYMNALATAGAHSEQYYTPPNNHPSEPNYVWLEGGSNFGLTSDADPSSGNLVKGKPHLVKLLDAAGVSWKSYQEGIADGKCPISSGNGYAAKHNPMVFYDDVVGNPPSATNAYCASHHASTDQFDKDVQNDALAQYNFVTPNLDDDMHDGTIQQADTWLKTHLDPLISSTTKMVHTAVFVIWDEGGGDGPIGMIIASPFAKPGYVDTASPTPYYYTHSSTLLTFQKIFGVDGTALADAGNAGTHDLSAFFTSFP